MDDLTRLAAIAAIQDLKARYWRGVDCKDSVLLRSVFTDDAVIDFRDEVPDGRSQPLPTPDGFVDNALSMLDGVATMHHGHIPEITFSGDREAAAIWPMEDNLWVQSNSAVLKFRHLRGFGHYHDRYVKTEKGWLIAATTLKRVHVQIR